MASSRALSSALPIVAVVALAAEATPEMFRAISLEPSAAVATPELMLCVVALCSSTAEAMVAWNSLIYAITLAISLIAEVALSASS